MAYYGHDPARFAQMKVGIAQQSSQRIGQSLGRIGESLSTTLEKQAEERKTDALVYRQAEEARDALARATELLFEYSPDAQQTFQRQTGKSRPIEIMQHPPDGGVELQNYLQTTTSKLNQVVGLLAANPDVPTNAIAEAARLPGIDERTRKAISDAYSRSRGKDVEVGVRERYEQRPAERAAEEELERRGIPTKGAEIQPVTRAGERVTGPEAEPRPVTGPPQPTQQQILRETREFPPEEVKRTGFYQGSPGELTTYQQESLALQRIRARNARAGDKAKTDSEFRRTESELWDQAKDHETKLETAQKTMRTIEENLREVEQQTAELGQKAADKLATPEQREKARTEAFRLRDKRLQLEKDLENQQEKISGIKQKHSQANRAWELYVDSEGELSMQEVLKRAQEGTPAEPGKGRGEGAAAGGGAEPPPTRPGERVERPEGQRRLMQLNRTNPQHRQIMERARQLHPIDKEAARRWLREQGYDA